VLPLSRRVFLVKDSFRRKKCLELPGNELSVWGKEILSLVCRQNGIIKPGIGIVKV
jgi:hypothetical protein